MKINPLLDWLNHVVGLKKLMYLDLMVYLMTNND